MIRGVFRCIEEFPSRIYRFMVEIVGPVTILACRVFLLACIWLMLLFGPLVLGCACGIGGLWTWASLAWAVVAIMGSVWGLNRAIKSRNAADRSAAARLGTVRIAGGIVEHVIKKMLK
jgi:hypothetical protein